MDRAVLRHCRWRCVRSRLRELVKTFERYTDRARRVVVLAQEEARLLNHNYIGTEHILLGLIHEDEGVAAKALKNLGASQEGIRSYVESVIGRGGSSPLGNTPFTPRAKKVIELSLREALQLGHNYIGTEHILLGLIREGEGVASQCLTGQFSLKLHDVRVEVMKILWPEAVEAALSSQPETVPEEEVTVTPEQVPEQWFLVEYLDVDGNSASMTVNSPDGWRVGERPYEFFYIGGHAIKAVNVITVFQVAGPPDNNAITPAGMKPLTEKVTICSDPATDNPPTVFTGHGTREAPYVIVEAAIPPSQMTRPQQEAAIKNALDVARRNDPGYGYTVPPEIDDLDLVKFRMKKWGDAMGKAISAARQSMGQSRLAGGIIYIPDDARTPPSYIAPSGAGLDFLEEIMAEFEDKAADDYTNHLRAGEYE